MIMTTFIAWKPSLSVFVDEIDDQHKQLYVRMNAFLESVIRGDGKQEVGQTLKFLIDYCVVHFSTEERYMKRHDYPAYPTHKQAHKDLTASVLEIKQEIEQGLTSQHIIALVNRLGAWVKDHIEKMDKDLGVYLGSVLGRSHLIASPSRSGTQTSKSPAALSEQQAVNGGRICGYAKVCATMFERFQDPESTTFWRTRYCLTRHGMDCQRRRSMDEGADPSTVPSAMLPNGEHLEFLGES